MLKKTALFIQIYNYHKKRPKFSVVTKASSSLYPWVIDARHCQGGVDIPYNRILTTEYTIFYLVFNF